MKSNRTLLVFYVLVGYVFLQFGWWMYELYVLNAENVVLHESIKQALSEQELSTLLSQKKWMVIGEAIVFFIIMIIGFTLVRRSFLRTERLNKLQNNFMLSVTHELKTPIAANQLILQTLQRRNLDPQTTEDLIKKSAKENERLNHLVNNILISAQANNHSVSIGTEKTNLGDLVKEEVERFAWEGRKIHLSTIDCHLKMDREAFSSILSNLLENAVKYSSDDIHITMTETSDTVSLSVIDEGIGISDEHKSKVTQQFYRIGDENTRSTKGTGLGLYIVQTLVLALGGALSIENNTPKGTNFTITFKKS